MGNCIGGTGAYFRKLGAICCCKTCCGKETVLTRTGVRSVKTFDDFTMVAYNTHQLLQWADVSNVDKIIQYIKTENYDIVCLQEVFDEKYRKVFVDGLWDTTTQIFWKKQDTKGSAG